MRFKNKEIYTAETFITTNKSIEWRKLRTFTLVW